MSRNRHPTTIAATIARFRNSAPPRFKENAAAMKYVMQLFETGVLAGIALVRDIEDLPEPERDAAAEALRIEFEAAIMANFVNAVNDMVDAPTSPQARSGQRGASEGQQGAPTSQFVPADSADGTPESAAYEELLGKLAGSPQAREIVKGEGEAS